ncbi:MAG: tetratricopeptide repeat-containing serine protease family protein [Verrucomicrobiota bacterium]
MNRPRPIRRLPLLLPVLLSIALAAAGLAPGQETNTPGQDAAGGTNRLQKDIPPPSTNSVAFQETKARAEKGEAAAQSELGLMYDLGQGVAQNYAEAVKWLRKAAEQGHPRAQLLLGLHCQNGDGVRQDYAEAVKWLRKAADQGGAEAQYSLGVCYDLGHGVRQDYAEAVKWYLKAAAQGDAMAQYNLGVCYSCGQGVPQDDAQAAKWYGQAAGQDVLAAEYNLGLCFHDGRGVAADFAEALKWFRKAAEQGDAAAQYDLGFMYDAGQGVPQDRVEAYKWYNLAAAQDETNSIRNRDVVSRSMTPLQIAEGQRLSRELVVRKLGGPANRADSQNSALVGTLPRFAGAGFFITEDGCLLTCYHVVENAARIAVRTKAATFPATLVKADKADDVALLKVTGKFSVLPVASSRGVKPGAPVFVVGFPTIDWQGFTPKSARGEISSLTGMQDDPREFQINVALRPGNAGGPLVDEFGNVVGLVEAPLADIASLAASASLPQNANYAMKSSVLNVLLESVPEVSAKLKEPNSTEEKFEDAVKDAGNAIALVLVY